MTQDANLKSRLLGAYTRRGDFVILQEQGYNRLFNVPYGNTTRTIDIKDSPEYVAGVTSLGGEWKPPSTRTLACVIAALQNNKAGVQRYAAEDQLKQFARDLQQERARRRIRGTHDPDDFAPIPFLTSTECFNMNGLKLVHCDIQEAEPITLARNDIIRPPGVPDYARPTFNLLFGEQNVPNIFDIFNIFSTATEFIRLTLQHIGPITLHRGNLSYSHIELKANIYTSCQYYTRLVRVVS